MIFFGKFYFYRKISLTDFILESIIENIINPDSSIFRLNIVLVFLFINSRYKTHFTMENLKWH